jgi:hypothetical protein
MTSVTNIALKMENGMPFLLHVKYYWYAFPALKFVP